MDRIIGWRAIGQSVRGTSHVDSDKECEDAIEFSIFKDSGANDVLVCCVSDGAGSAKYAAVASEFATQMVVSKVEELMQKAQSVTEADIYTIAEEVYGGLVELSAAANEQIDEYSCTLLGCILLTDQSVFFQIGDGAIVRNDGDDFYTPVWWPQNGEYHNSTSFIADDENMPNLQVIVSDDVIDEVAIFTDGLQLLALKNDTQTAHQPFFVNLFNVLRTSNTSAQVVVLEEKLAQYLNSDAINERTDDDKTLFLATRLTNEI